MRRQIKIGNSFMCWLRFFGKILIKNIAGRRKAEEIEQEHVDEFRKQHGHNPRGNF